MLLRYLADRPEESDSIVRLFDLVQTAVAGPNDLLMRSAVRIGFDLCPKGMSWVRPGRPRLPVIAGPLSHLMIAMLEACRDLNSADLCSRKNFREGEGRGRKGKRRGPLLDYLGPMQLLNSGSVRERGKALSRAILSGAVWNSFPPWQSQRTKRSLSILWWGLMVMVIFSGSAPSPLLPWYKSVRVLSSMILFGWLAACHECLK